MRHGWHSNRCNVSKVYNFCRIKIRIALYLDPSGWRGYLAPPKDWEAWYSWQGPWGGLTIHAASLASCPQPPLYLPHLGGEVKGKAFGFIVFLNPHNPPYEGGGGYGVSLLSSEF